MPDQPQQQAHSWRKYSAVMYGMTLGFILALIGKLTGDFTIIVTVGVAAFQVANAATYFAKKNGK